MLIYRFKLVDWPKCCDKISVTRFDEKACFGVFEGLPYFLSAEKCEPTLANLLLGCLANFHWCKWPNFGGII